LASRLLSVSEEQARAELEDIIELTRSALSEVRELAKGYRDLDLADELVQAQALLRGAGITVQALIPAQLPLKCEVATVLGAALREGVTNVLRHSDARVCEVRIERSEGVISLVLRNDRALPVTAPADVASGNGLRNLAERAAAVGGRLRADRPGHGWFRLVVECPSGPRKASRAPGLSVRHPYGSAPRSC
jgi:two-component system sensor histidine kinase DesK